MYFTSGASDRASSIIVAGFSKGATDLNGCLNFAKDFVVAGTALWEPDLEPEDLFETITQAVMNAIDRDAFSVWGAVVHVM